MNKLNNNLSEIFDVEPIKYTEIVEVPIKTDLEIKT